jgi:hypothetical protein
MAGMHVRCHRRQTIYNITEVSTPSAELGVQRQTCVKNVARTKASVSCRRPGMDVQKASKEGEASTSPGMEHTGYLRFDHRSSGLQLRSG